MRDFYWEDRWYFGANFIPSNAVNQLEMWQDDTFSPALIRRELGYAGGIGMNMMRVFLHDLLWEQDAGGLLSKMDAYLSIADSLGIKTMFVFFDDCWRDDFSLGKQPQPAALSHNPGWIKSPGTKAAADPAQRARLEKYVKGVLAHFAYDKRIAAWDLYNEPGNGSAGDHITKTGLQKNRSLPLLLDVFRWAKEVSPSQPYTVGIWDLSDSLQELNDAALELSDILSFHIYADQAGTRERCRYILEKAGTRPVLCTEYMARHIGSTFSQILPLFKEHRIGAINWGLVSGKTQTVYPWDGYQEKDRYAMPFHDIFEKDGSLLYPEDRTAFEAYTLSDQIP